MHFIIGLACIVTMCLVAFGGGLDIVTRSPGSALIVLGTALGGGLMAAGPRTGEALRSVFLALRGRDATVPQMQSGARLMRTARIGGLAGGFFAAIAGIILVIKDLDDPGSFGPSMSLTLEALFWALFLGYAILMPLQTTVEVRLMASGDASTRYSEAPLDLLVLVGGFVFGGILLALMNYLF